MSSITPSVCVRDQAVLDLVVGKGCHAVGGHPLEPVENAGTVKCQPSHVADVEETHPLPDRLVLFADGRVLDGHRPPAKLDEPAAVALVPVMKRGLEQRSVGSHEVLGGSMTTLRKGHTRRCEVA